MIRSARARGIRTVAIYSEADRDALHVREADVAVLIGPTPASESYLNIERVVDAAVRTGADAVHPGYGFLSERAEFVRAVTKAGLTFVGPGADVMEAMGRKDRAREIAERAGVPVVPRVEVSRDSATAHGATVDAGQFPVLVKAAAGGGGKGMRIVREAADLESAVASAQREARSAFGDDTILVERYVERGRHVEVQVFGDEQGNVVHLAERDCSAQRRHQKVLEEAPAPDLTPTARTTLLESAVALAREVGYVNAGTVEFLVDGDEVYFLEMNARLQVEHPVTELVVRVDGRPLDLVDLQLRVAQGEPLGFDQEAVTVEGHAMEARVYAEDAFGGFLPQAGTATVVRWPEAARVDHALESGQSITTSYDPMLAKVIVHGDDRESARRALVAALDDTAVLGLTTNVGFVRALAAGEAFRDNQVHTAWLDQHSLPAPDDEVPRIIAAWTDAAVGSLSAGEGPFQPDGWRLGGDPAPSRVSLDRELLVDLARGTVTVDGEQHPVTQQRLEQHQVVLDLDERRESACTDLTPHAVDVAWQGQRFVFERQDPFAAGAAGAADGTMTAPMPGTVLSVDVEQDATVAEGDTLGVLEAMKMELVLRAPFEGTVTTVAVSTGDQVALGAELFVVEPSGGQVATISA